MRCENCNRVIDDDLDKCPKCGASISKLKSSVSLSDKGGFLWGMLGFFLPCLISIILYFIILDTKPTNAKALLIGIILNIVLSIIVIFYSGLFIFFINTGTIGLII